MPRKKTSSAKVKKSMDQSAIVKLVYDLIDLAGDYGEVLPRVSPVGPNEVIVRLEDFGGLTIEYVSEVNLRGLARLTVHTIPLSAIILKVTWEGKLEAKKIKVTMVSSNLQLIKKVLRDHEAIAKAREGVASAKPMDFSAREDVISRASKLYVNNYNDGTPGIVH